MIRLACCKRFPTTQSKWQALSGSTWNDGPSAPVGQSGDDQALDAGAGGSRLRRRGGSAESACGATGSRRWAPLALFQVADWVLPLAPDALLSRGHLGDGCADITGLSSAVHQHGYDGWVEVEIFRQEVWEAPARPRWPGSSHRSTGWSRPPCRPRRLGAADATGAQHIDLS